MLDVCFLGSGAACAWSLCGGLCGAPEATKAPKRIGRDPQA
jgi:hypothetical protein